MARNRTKSRLYRRSDRWWADLRSWSDVGGRREPLVPAGARSATMDRDVAEVLLATRIRELERARHDHALLGFQSGVELADYVRHHLIETKKSGKVTDRWIQESEHRMGRAIDFLGPDKKVATISGRDVQSWCNSLREIDSPRGGKLSDSTVRLHLVALSKMFRRARSEGIVPSGYNPVSDLIDPPTATRAEASFLDLHDAALLLEAARRYSPHPGASLGEPIPGPMMHAIIGVLLLTGARLREALGLEVGDLSFNREKVTIRPNRHRRLKTDRAYRTLIMFPQLAGIMSGYLTGGDAADDTVLGKIVPKDSLLFPSPRTGGMIHDIRKALDKVGESAGWKAGEIRPHMLRHTYCSHRLQTLDNGAPVSPFLVGRELGHGGTSLVERVYGHLGTVRHRSENLEYRIENHQDELAGRLKVLGW